MEMDPNSTLPSTTTTWSETSASHNINTCQYLQEMLQFGTLAHGHFTQDIFNTWIEDTKQQTKFKIIAHSSHLWGTASSNCPSTDWSIANFKCNAIGFLIIVLGYCNIKVFGGWQADCFSWFVCGCGYQ
jgi:hypothetical protein